ncbi:unnamed protein product, partial [Laminaria digitata]
HPPVATTPAVHGGINFCRDVIVRENHRFSTKTLLSLPLPLSLTLWLTALHGSWCSRAARFITRMSNT